MLPEEVIQNILCALEGTDQILQKLSTKKKPKGARAVVRSPHCEHPIENSYECEAAPSVASGDSSDAGMSTRLVVLLPALVSLLGFSRIRRGPVANITEHHCTADAVGL